MRESFVGLGARGKAGRTLKAVMLTAVQGFRQPAQSAATRPLICACGAAASFVS